MIRNNKNYLIFLSAFITCTSMAMEEQEKQPNMTPTEAVDRLKYAFLGSKEKVDEKVVATFPQPVARFGLSDDGKQLVTSEYERWLNTKDKYIVKLRVWKQADNGMYNEITSRHVVMPRKRGFAIWWLNDNKRFALVTTTQQGYSSKPNIFYKLLHAETLEDAGKMDRAFTAEERNEVFLTHARDGDCFRDGGKELISWAIRGCGEKSMILYPDRVCIADSEQSKM